MSLQYPEYLANGELVLIDGDLLDKLRYGDPISGWEGDPNMNLWYNNHDDRIYLSTFDGAGEEYVVCRSPIGKRTVDMNLLDMLVRRDPKRGYNIAEDIEKDNEAVIEKRESANAEAHEEVAKKLAWGIKKDLS